MIPTNEEELHALAGEYVLGVLDPEEARAIAEARAGNEALNRAILFWQERLHPLSSLAKPAEPPAGTWRAIEARIEKPTARAGTRRFWDSAVAWRWSTAGFAGIAAALAVYIAVAPPLPVPSFVAVLHAPQQEQASWVATANRSGLFVRALAAGPPPSDRTFELWAIAPDATRPRSLGVIPADGVLKLGALPVGLTDGATLAISIEPVGGSPTGQPTGPVVFVGSVKAL